MELIDALERATEAYEQRLVAVAPRQWGQLSACDGPGLLGDRKENLDSWCPG